MKRQELERKERADRQLLDIYCIYTQRLVYYVQRTVTRNTQSLVYYEYLPLKGLERQIEANLSVLAKSGFPVHVLPLKGLERQLKEHFFQSFSRIGNIT